MVKLEQSKLFGKLEEAEMAALKRSARELIYAPGQEVFKEGDAGDSMFVVKDGLVEISIRVSDSARHVFSQVEPGDFFGEMAVIEDKPRSACAVARQPTIVYAIPRHELLGLVDLCMRKHMPRRDDRRNRD